MQTHGDGSAPLYRQIYNRIHAGIADGTYPVGSKLPSIRAMAEDLNCSRNTVEAAYTMLTEEGSVVSRPGSGYRVQDPTFLSAYPGASRNYTPKSADGNRPARHRYDFTYGNLEPDTFPATAWRTLTGEVLMGPDRVSASSYTDPNGEWALRNELAWRLRTLRYLDCTPEQIIIQGGTQSAVLNLLTLFNARTDTIAMEDPGFNGVRSVFERSDFRVAPCRITDSIDDFFDDLDACGAKLIYVTPSSQFPTCKTMPIKTRARLIAWAEKHDAYILEDDYCRDFRYRERSLPPLQSMDQSGRVIYMGTFSKSLSPAMRLNYFVLPQRLLDRWNAVFAQAYPAVPWLSQAVVARFMGNGSWDRHLRKLQTRNRKKYHALLDAIDRHMGGRVKVLENGTGLHVLVDVPGDRCQDELIALAAAADVSVYDTKKYWMDQSRAPESCVLIGFSAIALEDIEPGIAALAQAWFKEVS